MAFRSPRIVRFLLLLTVSAWVLSSFFLFTTVCIATDYTESYYFKVRCQPSSYTSQYQIRISVSSSLYSFYYYSSHSVYSDEDQAKFITPYAVQPVAKSIWKVCGNGTNSDEAFADAALDIVHQLEYDSLTSWQYPIETLVTKSGKCCTLSFLAASIMKAGGLDIVLLEYESANHMAIGVKLSHDPIYMHTGATKGYVNYSSSKYWVAECTAGVYEDTGETVPWQEGRRVGEVSNAMRGTPTVIPPQSSEVKSSEQTKTHLTCSPTLSLSLSVYNATVDQQLAISGRFSIPLVEKIDIVMRTESNPSWSVLALVNTSLDGSYSYLWHLDNKGIFYVAANFAGVSEENMTINTARSSESKVYVYPVHRNPTTISLLLSSSEATVGQPVTITGKLSIPVQVQVEIRIRSQDYGYWWTLSSVSTNPDGTYSYLWYPQTTGKYWLAANFAGDIDNSGTSSSEFVVNVHPTLLAQIAMYAPYIGAVAAITAGPSCAFFLFRRRRRARELELSLPTTEDYDFPLEAETIPTEATLTVEPPRTNETRTSEIEKTWKRLPLACPKCNKKISKDYSVCPYCGFKLKEASEPDRKTSES